MLYEVITIAFPLMKKTFRARGINSDPLLAHSYERVMPGRNYVAVITSYSIHYTKLYETLTLRPCGARREQQAFF